MILLINLEGLSLNTPIHGLNDANSMFLFAAETLTASSQALSISLPKIKTPTAKAIVGYGSQNSFKLGARAGTPFDKYSTIFFALQMSTTDGNFSFSSPDVKNDSTNNFIRENNHHHRLQAVVKYDQEKSSHDAHVLFAFNDHHGGIAGFSLSPTPNLRSNALFSGLKTSLSFKTQRAFISIDVANSVFDHKTYDIPSVKERLTASSHELAVGFRPTTLPNWLKIDLEQKLIIERLYQFDQTRLGGGFSLKRAAQFAGRLKPKISGSLTMIGFHEHGIVRKTDLLASIEPSDFLSISASAKHNFRLPTFMEMYADNNFFVGNKNLNAENIWDLELGSSFYFLEHSHLQIHAYMGFISDIIVYVPFLIDKVRPINTGSARRYGLDFSFVTEPFSWLSFSTKNTWLRSKIIATNAPLPQAPTFFGFSRLRLLPKEIFTLTLQTRYRSSTTATIFGTLRTKPYMLFDAIIAKSIYDHASVSVDISNIFNVKSARDAYEIPVPGTTIFGQLEIGNVL